MNARDFLVERDFQTTLAFTYSFDPVFFERIVLPALWAGGADDVLVLADAGEVDRSLARAHGPIHHLGRRYILAPVVGHGRFHPKLVLRLGREEGRVWVSSGNLTHGGLGLNREVAVSWPIGAEHPDKGAWVRTLISAARMWAPGGVPAPVFDRIEDVAWLHAPMSGAPRVLVSGERTLAQQLEARWSGRRFTSVRLLTGSTDDGGSIFRWLARTYGVQTARVALTPARCSWTASSLRGLPVALRIYPAEPPVVHAKAYHLSGPDGDALVVGSANCTASAWLRPASQDGNVEMVVVYDDATQTDVAFFDSLMVGDGLSPTDALREAGTLVEEEATPTASPIRVRAVLLDEDSRLVAMLEGVPLGADVYLVLPEERIHLVSEGGAWIGRSPDTLPPGQTAFCHIEVEAGRRSLRSSRRWIDDLRLLHEAGGMRRLGRALSDLGRSGTPREDDRLLQELSRLAHDLINDVVSFRDPFRQHHEKTDAQRPARPVDPGMLIRSLKGEAVPSAHPLRENDAPQGLGGIYRALFGEERVEAEGTEVAEDEEEQAAAKKDQAAPETNPAARPRKTVPVADRVRERFCRHMDRFVGEFESEAFGARCTARQLVQAAGYPFAACALGVRREWTDYETARGWLIRTAGMLLHGRDGSPALLHAVRARYDQQGATDVFLRAIGEGTLWVVMTLGLVGLPWPGPVGNMRRLVFIRDLWRAEDLRATASLDHVERLTRRYNAGDAVGMMREVAAPVGRAMSDLEVGLSALCATTPILRASVPDRPGFQQGELLWGPANGWAIALEAENDGKVRIYFPKRGKDALVRTSGYFVSPSQAAAFETLLQPSFSELSSVLHSLIARDGSEPDATSG